MLPETLKLRSGKASDNSTPDWLQIEAEMDASLSEGSNSRRMLL